MSQNMQIALQSPVSNGAPPGTGSHRIYNAIFQGYPYILSVQQVGERLNVSSKTVYRLLNEVSLASLKVGSAYKIPKLHVPRYIRVLDITQ